MRRRDFISYSSAIALAPLLVSACKQETLEESGVKSGSVDDFELNEVTIEVLQEKMKNGSYNSRQITQLYLDRITEIDKQGPSLNSVIEINPDALLIADQMDQERKGGKLRGKLHGIPILIKDNIDTADKMLTTAGSLAMEGNIARHDAGLVKRLRDAGAVILGKTNLSEWANFRSTRSSSGWSSRGGQTKNPYELSRNPCGSSSGSGTAVSANLCAVAIGTETNGSIACPSSINGIVGFKPTVGLVSRSGIIPISNTQDTAGPMTRTVTDAAVLLSVMAGPDERDTATIQAQMRKTFDYTQYLDANGLKGKRIGVEKSYLHVHEAVDALLQKAIEQMRTAGAEIVEVEFRNLIKVEGAEYELLQFEFKDGLNKYLANANGKVKSLTELIAFNKQNEEIVMPYFKQEILESSEKKGDLHTAEYKKAYEKIVSFRSIIDQALAKDQLDAICGPATGPSWCTDLINGDSFTGYGMYSPAAMAGYPHITIPMGHAFGLPIGFTFFAGAFREPELFAIGFAYEQVSKNRTKPEFRREGEWQYGEQKV
jgi:amidase